MPKPLKFRERLELYPPILIRLLAVKWRGHESKEVLTDREIAKAGALTMAEVKRLSYSTSWAGIPIDLAYRFLAGCGIDLEKRRTLMRLEYMRRSGKFVHLRKSPLFESQFQEMLEIWSEAA